MTRHRHLLLFLALPMLAHAGDGRTATEFAKCGGKVITVKSAEGTAKVERGTPARVDVPSSSVSWYCDGNQQNTTCPAGTLSVGVEWTDGRVVFACFPTKA